MPSHFYVIPPRADVNAHLIEYCNNKITHVKIIKEKLLLILRLDGLFVYFYLYGHRMKSYFHYLVAEYIRRCVGLTKIQFSTMNSFVSRRNSCRIIFTRRETFFGFKNIYSRRKVTLNGKNKQRQYFLGLTGETMNRWSSNHRARTNLSVSRTCGLGSCRENNEPPIPILKRLKTIIV